MIHWTRRWRLFTVSFGEVRIIGVGPARIYVLPRR